MLVFLVSRVHRYLEMVAKNNMGKKSATQLYRDLGKSGGSTQDFRDLYFKLKGKRGIKDPSIQDMMMSGAMQSELKKGGLVRKGKPRLTKKGWK